MKEEKYIESLFEAARTEKPELSFEQTARNLDASLNPGAVELLKDWFLNRVYLNSILLLSGVGIIGALIILNPQSVDKPLVEMDPLQEIPVKAEQRMPNVVETDFIETKEITSLNSVEPIKEEVKKNTVKQIEIKKPKTENSFISQSVSTPIVNEEKKLAKITPFKEPKIESSIVEGKEIRLTKQELSQVDQLEKKAQHNTKQTELEQILEVALNLDFLKEDMFVRNRDGNHQQLIVKTNRKFDDMIDIQFAGKKVIVIDDNSSKGFNIVGGEFVDVQEFKIERQRSTLEFVYNSMVVNIKLTNENGIWLYKESSVTHQQEDYIARQELIQLALDHERMIEIVNKNDKGEFKTFALLANGHFSNMLEIKFNEKPIEIVPFKYNKDYNRRITYAEFTKFQVKKKKASLQFSYDRNLIEVNFRNKNGEWIMNSFTHKDGNSTYKDSNF